MAEITKIKTPPSVLEILRRIREGSLDPTEILRQHRRMCVAYLRYEGYTQEEIAEIFKVHRLTITRDEKANRTQLATMVDELDVKSVAGGLIAWAKQLTAKSLREKDYALAWKIQRELISDLQGLGYLPKSPEQHQLQIGTFVDLVRMAGEQAAVEICQVTDNVAQSLLPVVETEFEKESDDSQCETN